MAWPYTARHLSYLIFSECGGWGAKRTEHSKERYGDISISFVRREKFQRSDCLHGGYRLRLLPTVDVSRLAPGLTCEVATLEDLST